VLSSSDLLGLLASADKCIVILQNIMYYMPIDMLSHCRRLEFSSFISDKYADMKGVWK
jgi:hypothetical protein